jgi:hypothetical protein
MGELPRGATGLAWSSLHGRVMFTESGTGMVMEQGEEDGELIQITKRVRPSPRGICFAPNGNHFFLESENDSRVGIVRMGDFFEHKMIRRESPKAPSPDCPRLRTNGICYAQITRGIFIASEESNQILFLTGKQGKVSVVGTGEAGFSSGNKGEACLLDSPAGVAFSKQKKRLYVADTGNRVIREFSIRRKDFIPERLCGFPGEAGRHDGNPSWARFSSPADVSLSGNHLFIADGPAIRKLDLDSFEVSTEYNSGGNIMSLASDLEGNIYCISEN